MRRLIVLLAAFTVLLAACGGGDGDGLSAEEQALANAIAADASSSADVGDPFSDAEAAQCMADGVVADIGVARFTELGVSADSVDSDGAFAQMTDGEIDKVIDRTLECVDMGGLIADQMAASGLDQATADCFAAELDDDFYRVAFKADLRGEDFDPTTDPDVADTFVAALTKCLTD